MKTRRSIGGRFLVTSPRRGRALTLAALGAAVALGGAAGPRAASAAPQRVERPSSSAATATPPTAQVNGSGSSWAANAINQWVADVQQQGLTITYNPDGSAAGRQDFAYGTSDLADSDIGYQGKDPLTGATDYSNRPYAYIPVVAGGTSFPYQLRVGGQMVNNLRLSGLTLAKIFANQITNWNDPAITADNNGRAFPSLPIIPVVHSEGSGDTAQFSQYLATEFPSQWQTISGSSNFTEYWPQKGQQVAENGSDGVINYITSAAANGSIGYDEYSYALGVNYPVAKIENAAGYFTLPTQYNVAVALTKAQINENKSSPNYLLQTLTNVYSYSDPRTYPLSSYSYGIIPTSPSDSKLTPGKAQTMADFFDYSVCQGQREIGPIGYSSLPVNLVQAAFAQINDLKTAEPSIDIEQNSVAACHNPTFVAGQPNENYLAEVAPQPPSCDKSGAGPCASGNDTTGPVAPGETSNTHTGTASVGTTGTAGTAATGSAGSAGSAGLSGASTGTGAASGSTKAGSSTSGGAAASGVSEVGSAGQPANVVAAAPEPTSLASGPGNSELAEALVAIALVVLALLPPYVVRRRRNGVSS